MSLPAIASERVYKYAPLAAVLILFFWFTWVYLYCSHGFYISALEYYGVQPFGTPFLDISGSLAAWECARQGIDVIISDPCDVLKRPYSYSPIWMSWSAVPLGITDTPLVGWIAGLLFLLSLSALPRPRRPVELVVMLAATLSTTVVYGVERANPDILLFVLALATGLSAEGGAGIRTAGYALALLAGLYKYYPIVTMILAVEERVLVLLLVAASTVLAFALFGVVYFDEIVRTLPYIPHGLYNEGNFGAKNLPFEAAEMVSGKLGTTAAGFFLALVAGGVAVGYSYIRDGRLRAALDGLEGRERNLLVIGSTVICGCFFAGQSIWYRGVFFLLVLPGLLGLWRGAVNQIGRKLSLATTIIVVLLMWEEFFRFGIERLFEFFGFSMAAAAECRMLFWLIRELAWWWVAAVLGTVVVLFIWRSAVVRQAMSRVCSRTADPSLAIGK
jgi:hypothetical protein